MNTRNMTGPRRVDSRWPQTILIERRRAPRVRVLKPRPLVDVRDPFEVGGAIAAVVGLAVVVSMWTNLL
jgi:hypothetical protein